MLHDRALQLDNGREHPAVRRGLWWAHGQSFPAASLMPPSHSVLSPPHAPLKYANSNEMAGFPNITFLLITFYFLKDRIARVLHPAKPARWVRPGSMLLGWVW